MKKVVFSLKSIALVAVASLGMVSCGGSDDSSPEPTPTPTPTPTLTENFISTDGVQSATTETRWYVRAEGNTASAPIVETSISEGDTTKYAIFDLVTFGEDDKLFNTVYAVQIDETKAANDGRYYYPYTSETFKTVIIGAYYVEGDADYEFGSDFKITPTALSYQNKTMTYTASGTAESKQVEVNYDGAFNGMYILDMSKGAKTMKGSFNTGVKTNALRLMK